MPVIKRRKLEKGNDGKKKKKAKKKKKEKGKDIDVRHIAVCE